MIGAECGLLHLRKLAVPLEQRPKASVGERIGVAFQLSDDLRIVGEETDMQTRQPQRAALLLHQPARRRVVEGVQHDASVLEQ